jgi:hypothetical protein
VLLSAFVVIGGYWWLLVVIGGYWCNIFKPNPRVCRRVFPHRCPCGGHDILFEIVDDVNQFFFFYCEVNWCCFKMFFDRLVTDE